MLADACPNQSCQGLPLMRKKGTATSICVLCDQDAVDGANGGGPTGAAPELAAPLPKTTPSSTPAIKRAPPPTPADLARLRAAAAAKSISVNEAKTSAPRAAERAYLTQATAPSPKEDATTQHAVVHKVVIDCACLAMERMTAQIEAICIVVRWTSPGTLLN